MPIFDSGSNYFGSESLCDDLGGGRAFKSWDIYCSYVFIWSSKRVINWDCSDNFWSVF